MNNLILIGFKSAGKTTLGRWIASQLGRSFIDTDDLFIESPRVSYQKLGEAEFRDLEKSLLHSLLSLQGCVIATGGGLVCDPDNCLILRQLGTLIHLDTPKEIIRERIFASDLPAFLAGSNPAEKFESLYHNRLGIYKEIAHHSIRTEEELWEVIHSDPFSV